MLFFLIISFAFFSTLSLLDNAQAQTNSSTIQSQPSQQQQMNMTAQALMKTDIVEIKDTLAKSKLEIIQGNLKEGLQDVRDVETQLFLIEPSPTKLLSNINKTINAIAKSNIEKALDILTNVQVTILKAENQIFKAAVENPQVMQQVDTSKNIVATPQPQEMQQFDTLESNTNADDLTSIEDS